MSRLMDIAGWASRHRRLLGAIQIVLLAALLHRTGLGVAARAPRGRSRSRQRQSRPLRPRLRRARRLLPRVRRRLDADPRGVGDRDVLSGRLAGRDDLDARQVHPGRGLDSGRPRGRSAAGRGDRRGARDFVDAPRGGNLGGRRRDRLRGRPAVRRQRGRTARAPRHLRCAYSRSSSSRASSARSQGRSCGGSATGRSCRICVAAR